MHSAQLSLPTPFLGHLLAILLPTLTALTLLLPRDGYARAIKPLTRHIAFNPTSVLALLDAALLALAGDRLAPDVLPCTLDRRWLALFSSHNAAAVRAIQDAFACCGLRSTVDRAFPFQGRGTDAHACEQTYHRSVACGAVWTGRARVVLGIWIAVGAGGLVLKVLALVLARRQEEGSWYRGERREGGREGRRERVVGRIEGGGERESEEGTGERLLEEANEETPVRA